MCVVVRPLLLAHICVRLVRLRVSVHWFFRVIPFPPPLTVVTFPPPAWLRSLSPSAIAGHYGRGMMRKTGQRRIRHRRPVSSKLDVTASRRGMLLHTCLCIHIALFGSLGIHTDGKALIYVSVVCHFCSTLIPVAVLFDRAVAVGLSNAIPVGCYSYGGPNSSAQQIAF